MNTCVEEEGEWIWRWNGLNEVPRIESFSAIYWDDQVITHVLFGNKKADETDSSSLSRSYQANIYGRRFGAYRKARVTRRVACWHNRYSNLGGRQELRIGSEEGRNSESKVVNAVTSEEGQTMDVVSPKLAEEYLYWAVVEHVRGWLGEDGAFRRAIDEKKGKLDGVTLRRIAVIYNVNRGIRAKEPHGDTHANALASLLNASCPWPNDLVARAEKCLQVAREAKSARAHSWASRAPVSPNSLGSRNQPVGRSTTGLFHARWAQRARRLGSE